MQVKHITVDPEALALAPDGRGALSFSAGIVRSTLLLLVGSLHWIVMRVLQSCQLLCQTSLPCAAAPAALSVDIGDGMHRQDSLELQHALSSGRLSSGMSKRASAFLGVEQPLKAVPEEPVGVNKA